MRKYVMFDFGYGAPFPARPNVVASRHEYDYVVRINLGYVESIFDMRDARRSWWGDMGRTIQPLANRNIERMQILGSP